MITSLAVIAMVLGFSVTSSLGAENETVLIASFDRAEDSARDADTTASASEVSDATLAAMALMIQEQIGGGVFSITVLGQYPSDRVFGTCAAENSANARQALCISVQNMEQYDTVFLGFPDWCGTCPMAVFTFLESYDFSGKKIIPFCAHGTSGFGTSIADIKTICPNTEFGQEFGVYRDSVVIHAIEPIENESLILAGYSDRKFTQNDKPKLYGNLKSLKSIFQNTKCRKPYKIRI